jgi:hypothetical protein
LRGKRGQLTCTFVAPKTRQIFQPYFLRDALIPSPDRRQKESGCGNSNSETRGLATPTHDGIVSRWMGMTIITKGRIALATLALRPLPDL